MTSVRSRLGEIPASTDVKSVNYHEGLKRVLSLEPRSPSISSQWHGVRCRGSAVTAIWASE
ncbi:hypothetical protein IAQ61_001870 [Plenodomus lingam]|uniref:Uncharacterized protein n=1 Tax=Leptosphaeria maculans (strain JN3 / isolate v23.1.3 / race Av1-4-5-6-7-8) TaxID=985895 RepID=E4ZGF2_LEPMJ|nr:predicted protein [Plenodomus lingam JN3]KAH9878598.1 hypothetical protein IAQ61_001870 [Plenodomus lingam]CBX90372.1 predicted protein [Plenodomus lingam JN3]